MLNLLRYTTVLLLIGRAYEHIRWIGPYRDFFYNPIGFGKWYAEFIGRDLKDIYNDTFYESLLSSISSGIGVIFILGAIVVLFYEKLQRFKWVIYLVLVFLFTTYMGYFMAKHFKMWGMLLEHALQFVTPILFLYLYKNQQNRALYLGVWATAFTFYFHGLFAMGYYPQPGKFVDMVIASTGLTEDATRFLLDVAGYLDILLALVIVIPFLYFTKHLLEFKWIRMVFLSFLGYAIIWGFFTSIARVYYSYNSSIFWHWMDQYWMEFLVRTPHFMIPLVLFILVKNNYSTLETKNALQMKSVN
jgi:hypothetical protein